MRRVLLVCLTLVLTVAVGDLWAQERTVRGKVTSAEDGLPIPGVNVLLKGTTNGVPTDANGEFSIVVPSNDAVLVFSFIGLQTEEIPVGERTILDVTMSLDVAELSEVVVVAYGEQTRRAIVGSVASVDSDIIGKQQLSSPLAAIQGAVPGVNIISAGGQPGDNPTIRVRGIGSINASADPLIVVDGVPFNGNINTISADQIESINVLKDASSTALYGSRASNGVLVITTKRGKQNSPTRVTLNASAGVAGQAVDMHELVSTDQYMELSWEAIRNMQQYVNGETAADAAQIATDELISNYLMYNPYGPAYPNPVGTDGRLLTTQKLWDTDWSSVIQNNKAKRQEYSMTVSGGSEKTSYFFSANYLDQEGSVHTSNFNRFTGRMNIDTKVNDWFSAGLNTMYSTQKQNYPDQSGSAYQSAIQWIYSVPSIYPVYRRDVDGALILDNFGKPIYDYGNATGVPLNAQRPALSGENAAGALYNYAVTNNRDNTVMRAYAQVDFTDYLSLRTNIGYEKYVYDGFTYAHNEFGYAANVGGRVSQSRDVTTTFNINNVLNFNKSFGDHNLDLTLVQEAYEDEINGLSAQGVGFLPNVKVLNGSTTPENVGGYITTTRMTSYLGRASYNFLEKYYLEASFRRDGSSQFSEATRWGSFWSVGGAWVISDEGFMQNQNFFDFVKLKASYGELGNNRGIGAFPYLQLFVTGWNQGSFTGVLLGALRDPNLRWEKTAASNYGIEFRMLNNRLTANVEYYDRESVDLIYDKPLPPSTGNSDIRTNVGAVRNHGLEVTLTSTNVETSNVTWTTTLNFSRDRNEITELTQESFISGTKRWEVGRSLFDFYLQDWAGVNPDNGYGMWYKDVLDGDGNPTGERETTEVYSEATRYYVGKSSLPDIIGGFSSYLRVGNFDLNILLNYSFGAYVYDGQYARLMNNLESPGDGAVSIDALKRWQKPGDITDVPLVIADNHDFNAQSTRFLFKNDYLRLRALNIGYNVPKQVLDRFGVNQLRVYFQGDNLLTFQSHKGLDPEQSLGGTTNNRSFNQRIASMGINLSF